MIGILTLSTSKYTTYHTKCSILIPPYSDSSKIGRQNQPWLWINQPGKSDNHQLLTQNSPLKTSLQWTCLREMTSLACHCSTTKIYRFLGRCQLIEICRVRQAQQTVLYQEQALWPTKHSPPILSPSLREIQVETTEELEETGFKLESAMFAPVPTLIEMRMVVPSRR